MLSDIKIKYTNRHVYVSISYSCCSFRQSDSIAKLLECSQYNDSDSAIITINDRCDDDDNNDD